MNAAKPIRRKSTNISLDPELVAEAREYGINLSRACEAGLDAEVREARKKKWQEENREAIKSSNEYFAKHGLPLAKYRVF
jgi:antitoxin CcdA